VNKIYLQTIKEEILPIMKEMATKQYIVRVFR